MKSYWIKPAGGSTVLEERDVPIPVPADGQLLVRVHAAGMNRGELITRGDLHGGSEARPAGTESAGVVETIGPGVSGFAPGDRVMATGRGSFAEFVLLDAGLTIRVPDVLTWEEAACTPLVFLVAQDMLIGQGNIKAGDWVLITAASSGVGVAAMQAAGALGAFTIGTSGSGEKLDRLRALGLNVGIETRRPDFYAHVMEATAGKGANIAVNGVGGTMFAECLRSLAFEGRLATVGYVDGSVESTIDLATLHAKRLKVFGVSAIFRTREQRMATVRGFTADLLPFIASGRIKPVVDRVFDFADLPAAKAFMESNAQVGKIAVRI
ncbi:MAG TPA: zinc-binding dehydrogenase [Candidatus Lustribacter sp.]|jgi:NADPH2:quinone reductase|nr:zinc-binding dehydrogenase [Candidatus Lustribacter sp.]